MFIALALLAVATGLVLAAQFYVHPEKKTGSPIAKFFAGGYWFDSLTTPGKALFAGGWFLAIVALFVGLFG